jgi:RND family efflux transporter MFP subunit
MNKLVKIVGLMATTQLLMSCSDEKIQQEIALRPVEYIQVSSIGTQQVRTFSGTSKTDRIIKLSFRSSGIIIKFDIKLGQKVSKGQLLAKLDNVQARLNHENSITAKNSAESQMNTAKLSYNRIRKLYEKGGSSLSEFESVKNAFKTAQQSYQSAIRTVRIQEDQIKYGYLYAAEDGIISGVNAEIDENINAGTIVATLNSGTEMKISLGLPESVINLVNKGMQAQVNFPSIIDKQFTAIVSEVSPAIDSNTATYPVTLKITQSNALIKSGMAANITFNFSDNIQLNLHKIVVPTHAVGEDSNGHYVFVIQEEDLGTGTIKKQIITIGQLTTEGFEVIGGLSEGQKIATAGLHTLLDGQQVKVK